MISDRGGAGAGLRAKPTVPSEPIGHGRVQCTCLTSFDLLYAPLVSSWIRSDQELEWLAPGTPPPLTAHKVAAWGESDSNRFLYWRAGDDSPGAYGELNRMPDRSNKMWIGHVIVAPERRGRSYGAEITAALVNRAFVVHRVEAALLVVFPENEGAVRCYRRIGMVAMGRERKHFKTTQRVHTFLRMGMDDGRFRAMVARGVLSAQSLPVRSRAIGPLGDGGSSMAAAQSKRNT